MKVLSLFDGMACGYIAFRELGIEPDEYIAYEIDKYAIKTAQHNFPKIKECGDVFAADFTQYDGVDFLIGGSPCTYWSIAQTKNRETVASGMGWELFSQYVRALHEAKPKYFLYENNKSMSKDIRKSIDEAFGFDATLINSALVSAQNRQRLYWVGKRNADGTYSKVDIEQPKDREILLKDVLDDVVVWQDKAHTYTTRYQGVIMENTVEKDNRVAKPIRVGTYPTSDGKLLNSQGNRIYGIDGKSVTQSSQGGGWGNKTGLYIIPVMSMGTYAIEFDEDGNPTKAIGRDGKTYIVYEVCDGKIAIKNKQYPIKLIDGYYIIRKLTVTECMRLQTVPEWYVFSVSDSQAYKMLGNGWTVDVISHLIKSALK